MVFFLTIFLLFFLSVKLVKFWMEKGTEMNPDVVYIIMGMIFSLVVASIYYLSSLGSCSEGFWDISKYALCKGGPYMWQGDSQTAEMCKALAETPEGRCGISSYNCPTGYNGVPMLPFEYTPVSDASWQNERCEDREKCPCEDVGLCAMQAQK
jgi:hypothetical protein